MSLAVATSRANVRYFTDYENSLEGTFLEYMAGPTGDCTRSFPSAATFDGADRTLIVHALLAVSTLGAWTGGLRVYGAEPSTLPDTGNPAVDALVRVRAHSRPHDFVSELAASICAQTAAGDQVALDSDGLTSQQLDALIGLLPDRTLLRAPVLLRLCRMVKSDEEIARSEAAAAASEEAFRAMLDAAYPQTSADELASLYRASLAAKGADLEHCAFGNYGLGVLTPPSRHPFESGDVMLADVGCTLNGVISDTGATLSIGPPSQEAVRQYASISESVSSGRDALRPGTRVATVHRAMLDVLRGAGLEHAGASGHGLGIEPKEYPLIDARGGVYRDECVAVDADIVLEPGMVVNLECPLSVPPSHSVHIEKTFVITDVGARELVAQDRASIACAPQE